MEAEEHGRHHWLSIPDGLSRVGFSPMPPERLSQQIYDAGNLRGTFWLRYGLLKLDLTMITVNVVGIALMFLYILFYLYYTKSKVSAVMRLRQLQYDVALRHSCYSSSPWCSA